MGSFYPKISGKNHDNSGYGSESHEYGGSKDNYGGYGKSGHSGGYGKRRGYHAKDYGKMPYTGPDYPAHQLPKINYQPYYPAPNYRVKTGKIKKYLF